MSTFNIKFLAGQQALITGTDEAGAVRNVILDATKYKEIESKFAHLDATDEFNAAVAEHFAALTEAAAVLKAATKKAVDPAFRLVVSEGNNTDRTDDEVIELDTNTAIIRMVVEEDTARLVWIGDSIAVLEYDGDDEDEDEDAVTIPDFRDLGVDVEIPRFSE